MTRAMIGLALLIAGCGVGEAGNDEPPPTLDQGPADSLVIPMFPKARPGRLTTRGAGPFDVDGSWAAWAGRCSDGSIVQLLAQGEAFGAAILVAPPDSGAATGAYPLSSETEGIPDPHTARFGLQLYPHGADYVFETVEGEVVLEQLDQHVSGRLTARMRERMRFQNLALAAVFEDVSIRPLDDEWCQVVVAEPDTGAALESR